MATALANPACAVACVYPPRRDAALPSRQGESRYRRSTTNTASTMCAKCSVAARPDTGCESRTGCGAASS
jgi:hypothetical protein